MRILFVTPGLAHVCGGFRVILEVASRLIQFGHSVSVYSLTGGTAHWFPSPPLLRFPQSYEPRAYDILVICSPHSIDLAERCDAPGRVVIWCQGLEHRFRPLQRWQEMCGRFYASRHPLMAISRESIEYIQQSKPFGAPIHYLQNGVNLEHFPIEDPPLPKDQHTVLFEGWHNPNPVKDPEEIGPKVALRLRAEGYRILVYSSRPVTRYENVPHEFHQCPNLQLLNDLYRRATILIKATKYDGRACAPVEAMTKGTVTARALLGGDDDLTPDNSLRTPYQEEALHYVATRLLTERSLRDKLAVACLGYIPTISWEKVMPSYEAAILGRNETVRTVIVSIVYSEPEWRKTKECIEACGVPVVYAERSPQGVGPLTEACNRGLKEALARYPTAQNFWLVTNVTFSRATLLSLERALGSTASGPFSLLHPVFASGHPFSRPIPGASGVSVVPFVELTAPIFRRSLLEQVGFLDESMSYWGQDLDYGMRAREKGFFIGVDHGSTVGHIYLHHLVNRSSHEATRRRAALRAASDPATRARLTQLYGSDWKEVTGFRANLETLPVTLPEPEPPFRQTAYVMPRAHAEEVLE